MIYDICIIGGGAAGLMAAVTAKEVNRKLRVVVLERLDRVGKKISLTGNGRCNITNRFIETKNYHGKNPQFTKGVFSQFSVTETEEFFDRIGVPIIYEGDKAFPSSLQAASVTDALRFRCDELGVETRCKEKVNDIKKQGDFFNIYTETGAVCASAVIVAAGMLSGGERLGCDGSVMGILKRLSLNAVAPKPAIVQLKTNVDFVKQLKGIKVNADVLLTRDGHIVRHENGEVLFCDYGLSGPPILQLSGSAREGDVVSLDLMPSTDMTELEQKLFLRKKNLSARQNDEFLSGLINKRLGQVVLKRAGLKMTDPVYGLLPDDIKRICCNIKAFKATVTGNTGFVNSQVTSGGILTDEFDENTLMCRKISGLFAAGEILDIDGDCGGYNLQWAWSSGSVAAKAANKFVEALK